MTRSQVYFTDFHATPSETLPQKLHRLMKCAGFEQIDFADRYAAIKIHFGELGNLAYLRPQYAKAVADLVKEQGGIPFLTDCNTLYPGSRKHALEHMDCANLNGFNTVTTGCQIIIGDGFRVVRTQEREVPQLTEVHLDSDKFPLHVDVLESGGDAKPFQLLRHACADLRAEISEKYLRFFHKKSPQLA